MTRNLFIFGFGFSSQEIADQAQGRFDRMYGTSRNAEKLVSFAEKNVTGLQFDGIRFSQALEEALLTTTHLVISIAPGARDPVLASMETRLGSICPHLQWIGYLSTVGVYGNHDGDWVDETSEIRPVSKRSKERVLAEQSWQKAAEAAEVPLAIFRLSGIYGPGRNAFVNIEKGTARRLVKPGQVFNRIHREDIGQAVCLAAEKAIPGIFNITDDRPSPPQDVVTFAHELMGIETPPEIDFESAELSAMARSFYGENKRVSNQKSKDVLGIKYRWPDYKTALTRMWNEGSWKS